ncbi:MAG: DNA polymerase III subunit alpha [Chlamydiae bacterium]|nr:DNA polymerase III subunit alpha [Chlamydiota bacterium]
MWVSLHQHSQYSILDASCPVEKIARKAKECGMPAVALTDHGNMYGAIDFYKACEREEVKPILGCEVYVAPTSRLEKKKLGPNIRVAYHLVLLAKNLEGYHNLCRLTSKGFLEGFYYYPRIDKELLASHAEGLICLSGCLSGMVAQAALKEGEEELYEEIRWHRDLFGDDYYLELQRHQMEEGALATFSETWRKQYYHDFIEKQQKVNGRLVDVGKKLGIPLVATNDTHYMEPDDWQAHEVLLNIQSGEPIEIWEKDGFGNPTFRVPNPKRRVYATHELYFKTPEQMQTLFADIPEAVSETLAIAKKCDLQLDFTTKHYPVYTPPDLREVSHTQKERKEVTEAYLKQLCEEGIPKRYTEERLKKIEEKYPGRDPMQVVRERLEKELSLIISKGMCDYLLIVWDFIHWAKMQGIPVGPGRGSGAGSIILYLIGVTDIEPLRFHLFFERFINPERVSYPDIDVDICMEGRGEVIDYTMHTYGRQNVAQIITFGTMKARMTIKDVGRVLSVPLAKVNQIAKLVPEELNMTLEKALEIDPDLHAMYLQDEEAKRIIDFGKKLEGSIRNTGIHAAGLIVSGDPLTDHIPLCLAKDSDIAATQFSMKPVEAVGMLKIDFLGLKTLTSIKIACEAVERRTGNKIDWVNLPLDDSTTYKLLHRGKTLGVFQMESGGMQDLARQLMPDKFEEIIAIGALYRPGPMGMIPSFINRKHKREPIEYDHPWLEPILEETYGIMVYQEQVMQIAQKLANYSLGEGDVLRRAMGKKDHLQMEKQREKFRKGAIENGILDHVATTIFDKMEKFASYGFNKSHAAAYGFLTYVTAYLKANYPGEWMAALMTCDRDDVSKVAKFIRESQTLHLPILPPDVNESGLEFVATEKGIRFAMSGIKGVGEGVVETIIKEREKQGPFTSVYNFFKRIDLKKVGKKMIESLVQAGAFDFTGWSRDALFLSIPQMYDIALKEQKEEAAGVLTFFSMMGEDSSTRFATPPKVEHPTPKISILTKEKELLGFFLTGHPMDAYKPILKRLSTTPLSDTEKLDHNGVFRSAFIIETVQVRISQKSQKKFAILRINDGMESFELPIWPDLFEQKGTLLEENQLLYAVIQVDKREESMRLSCRWFGELAKVDEKMLQECDQAFDQAKRLNRFYPKKPKPQELNPMETTPKKTVLIQLDLTKTHLSQILKLKQLLHAHSGVEPVQVAFLHENNRLATLYIDQGITPSPLFDKALADLPTSLL